MSLISPWSPVGLAVMVSYHLWLLYRIIKHPATTVIGINAINRRIWVRSMMEDPLKSGVLAVQTLRNNIVASTLLATMAIMLCSLMAVLMTNSNRGYRGFRGKDFVLGDTSDLTLLIKFFSILICFLLAFLLNVQSIRYYSHAGVLINVPARRQRAAPGLSAEYVAGALNRGSYFWSLGLRAFYFSFPMFLRIFGPVPMLASCVVLVCTLYFLDVYSGWRENGKEEKGEEEGSGVHGGCWGQVASGDGDPDSTLVESF